MIDVICERLRKNDKQSFVIGLGIGYSKNIGGGFYHNVKLDNPTSDNNKIFDVCSSLFDHYYLDKPIRKVTICCGKLINKVGVQLNIFETIDEIKEK